MEGEVAALERLYTALGLETGGIYSALHSLTSADDPVTVMPPAEGHPGLPYHRALTPKAR